MERSGKIGAMLRAIPGYAGYRDKEDRRDADRAVRDQIAAGLQQRAGRVDAVAAKVAGAGDYAAVGGVTNLSRDIRALETRILTATYGYGGLFAARDVDAVALDRIGAFDEALLAGVTILDDLIATLEAAPPAERAGAIEGVGAAVGQLERQFAARATVIETARPSTIVPAAPPVAAALDGSRGPTLSPAWELHERDAISVLGANGVIDARVEVDAGDDSFRLFRLQGEAPRAWLLVGKLASAPHGMLRDSTPPADARTDVIDGVPFALAASGRGVGAAIGAGGAATQRPVGWSRFVGAADGTRIAIALDWPSERQLFAGSLVDPSDVEQFGSSVR